MADATDIEIMRWATVIWWSDQQKFFEFSTTFKTALKTLLLPTNPPPTPISTLNLFRNDFSSELSDWCAVCAHMSANACVCM